MVTMTTFFGMSLGASVFCQSMDKVYVWIALHQDEKQERMEKEAEIRRVRGQLLQENKEEIRLLERMLLEDLFGSRCDTFYALSVNLCLYFPEFLSRLETCALRRYK